MPSRFQAPSAVIVIDAWSRGVNLPRPYVIESLLEFIQRDFVKCIVIASYAEWEIHGTRATPIEWPIWHNSRQIFNSDLNSAVPDYVGRSWRSFEHAHATTPPLDQLHHQFVTLDRPVTEPTLLEELEQMTTPSFAAWEMDQLVYLLNNCYPDIENIYLCGGAFEQCLRDRPLGLLALQHAIGRGVFKNIQQLLIPVQCVFNGKHLPFSEEIQANPHLLEPNWAYLPDQQLLVIQNAPNRESTISAEVQAALQQPPPTQTLVDIDAEHLLALEAARLDSRRRRGLL